MRLKSQTFQDCFYSGAIQGVLAWTIYAVVECWFSSILPFLIKPSSAYNPWGLTVLLFVLYPAIGAILGGSSGLGFHLAARQIQCLRNTEATILFPTAATFTLVLIFTLNLLIQFSPNYSSILPPLLVSLLILTTPVFRVMPITQFKRFDSPINPWTLTLTLLVLMWISTLWLDHQSGLAKSGSVLVYLVVIFSVSFLVQKMVETRRFNRSTTGYSAFPTRSFTLLTFVVFLVLGASFFLDQAHGQVSSNLRLTLKTTGHPNVILITMDTVRADHLSLYGYERYTTPYLEKLAEDATLYAHTISPSDMTLSTHASIFTGIYPSYHGAHAKLPDSPYGRPLEDKYHTLAEILSEKGYSTLAVTANYGYLGDFYNLDQGFIYYDQRKRVPLLQQIQKFYPREQPIQDALTSFFSDYVFTSRDRMADEITREVFTLLDKQQKEVEPFFLFINYMDSHWPYIPPPPFDTRYPGKMDKMLNKIYYNSLVKGVFKLKRKVTEEERNHMVSQYDGAIAFIDFHLGKLFARLKELGLYENSIIIITSDHGEAFGERDFINHGVSVYQDQVYIPLIIKYPMVKYGDLCNEVVSLIDLMPTILEVIGCEIPEEVQGESLLKLKMQKSRSVISESFTFGPIPPHPRYDRIEHAIFSGTFKFISSTAGKRELYDLSKDSNEKENLYRADDGVSRELETKLNQWLKTVREKSGHSSKLDPKTLDDLKALGYIQ